MESLYPLLRKMEIPISVTSPARKIHNPNSIGHGVRLFVIRKSISWADLRTRSPWHRLRHSPGQATATRCHGVAPAGLPEVSQHRVTLRHVSSRVTANARRASPQALGTKGLWKRTMPRGRYNYSRSERRADRQSRLGLQRGRNRCLRRLAPCSSRSTTR